MNLMRWINILCASGVEMTLTVALVIRYIPPVKHQQTFCEIETAEKVGSRIMDP